MHEEVFNRKPECGTWNDRYKAAAFVVTK